LGQLAELEQLAELGQVLGIVKTGNRGTKNGYTIVASRIADFPAYGFLQSELLILLPAPPD
jgi:hypothetical protein